MCGVAGVYGVDDMPWVERGLDLIKHRGPDAMAVERVDGAIHGHVRLAIQDPDPRSNQPFVYGDTVLSYVGECWNAKALREELQISHGVSFHTTGDTEVVAAALHYWGLDALPRIEGMFAMAWTRQGLTFLARDRFGKVPLYVLQDGLMGIRWASERRAFGDAAAQAMPVEPGAAWSLNLADQFTYYELATRRARPDAVDLTEWTHGRLWQSVRARLISDVGVCCLISGGLDSSLILRLAQRLYPGPVVAYTAVYDEDAADTQSAREVCEILGIELREVYVPEVREESVVDAIRAIEIPMKTQVEISLLCLPLAAQIAADGFKVCLSGEGADEIFGGYGGLMRKATSDAAWKEARLTSTEKMARGNFVRINKVFMAAGVECRTPFLDRQLVEGVLALDREECPPGKGLLKAAAGGEVPAAILARPKETFQGSSGVLAACEEIFAGNQIKSYNDIARDLFGGLPVG
jgi:asparagine synthase (glutamine-hydrolysing)